MIKNWLERMEGGKTSPARKPFSIIVWSCLGAFLGVYLIALLSRLTQVDLLSSLFLVGSFGASAILLYGVPEGEFSQPRNLVGGHIISAAIGISVYQYLDFDMALMGAFSVSLSTVAMHFTRTLHPPGGSTALSAIIGGSSIHSAGFWYVLAPIGLGVTILLVVALIFNNLSNDPKRHYPKYWF